MNNKRGIFQKIRNSFDMRMRHRRVLHGNFNKTVTAPAAAVMAVMLVMLAGAPAAEFKPSYDEAGVDEYIHVKANCLEILKKIQSERGIG